MAAMKPTILGHMDLITKLNAGNRFFDESAPRYRRAALEALRACHPRRREVVLPGNEARGGAHPQKREEARAGAGHRCRHDAAQSLLAEGAGPRSGALPPRGDGAGRRRGDPPGNRHVDGRSGASGGTLPQLHRKPGAALRKGGAPDEE